MFDRTAFLEETMDSALVRQLIGCGLMVVCFNSVSWLKRDLMLLMNWPICCLLISWYTEFALIGLLQSSLAAARADNFYYPPEWEPSQVCLNNRRH